MNLPGLIVTEAENGLDAMHSIERSRPDLVLSDARMPEMSGMELLESLCKIGNLPRFVFITANTEPSFRTRAQQLGAETVLYKPISAQQVQSAIRLVLDGGMEAQLA
jgi:two-component system response regulator YesN